MTKFSKTNIVAVTALSFLLAAPCAAFAGKSGGGGNSGANSGPKESLSLNYGSVKQTYKPQTSDRKKGSGKPTYQDIHFMQRNNRASP
jgi:type VI protein secretion system component Hcp